MVAFCALESIGVAGVESIVKQWKEVAWQDSKGYQRIARERKVMDRQEWHGQEWSKEESIVSDRWDCNGRNGE